jgi:hypothetical protein
MRLLSNHRHGSRVNFSSSSTSGGKTPLCPQRNLSPRGSGKLSQLAFNRLRLASSSSASSSLVNLSFPLTHWQIWASNHNRPRHQLTVLHQGNLILPRQVASRALPSNISSSMLLHSSDRKHQPSSNREVNLSSRLQLQMTAASSASTRQD